MAKTKFTKNELTDLYVLINSSISLNKISKKTGKSKSSICPYFRKLRGRTFRKMRLYSSDQNLIGEFVGLFAGDGCSYTMPNYKHRISLHFNITEKNFVDELISEVLMVLFNKKPMSHIQENCLTIYYYSKFLKTFVEHYLFWKENERKTYSVCLRSRSHPKDFIIGFLRGSVDSDGHISKKVIEFATVSPGLKDDISWALEFLGIKHSIYLYKEKRENRKDLYHIRIPKSERKKFFRIIKPRNISGD